MQKATLKVRPAVRAPDLGPDVATNLFYMSEIDTLVLTAETTERGRANITGSMLNDAVDPQGVINRMGDDLRDSLRRSLAVRWDLTEGLDGDMGDAERDRYYDLGFIDGGNAARVEDTAKVFSDGAKHGRQVAFEDALKVMENYSATEADAVVDNGDFRAGYKLALNLLKVNLQYLAKDGNR